MKKTLCIFLLMFASLGVMACSSSNDDSYTIESIYNTALRK